MKKKILKGVIIFFCIILVCLIGVVILFLPELCSLSSIEKVDDYGMYQMVYYADYGFDEFLKTGAKDDADIEAFVTKRLLKGLPFDFEYAPSMQLFTKPKNGYASVSTVNLAFAGYSKDNLLDGMNFDSFLTLAGPYLPFDGMNEKGLTMALLAVPEAHPAVDDTKVTLNTTTSIRLVLDKAATVEEAIDLLKQYNIYFSGDVDCHYI